MNGAAPVFEHRGRFGRSTARRKRPMKTIAALQDLVTAASLDFEPSAAELDAIEVEMPLIRAEVELLDAQIMTLDRIPTELDERRIRRVGRKVLAARRDLTNRTTTVLTGGAA
jgi:hypothetical protein